ncbi:MAG: Gfo/Idh/MocA family oxidoreductase [Victivallaceae bacterium]|nr:Gfo/Idh/MocA family oxidoreductase [Victivallaceae bacterium]
MKKVKIGLIGCGKITRASHAPAFAQLPGSSEVVGLFDTNPKAAEQIQQDIFPNAVIYSSVEELLAADLNGVVISTPNSLHHPLTMQALAADCHVLIEKPMAVDLQQADEMIAEAHKKQLVLQVNQSLRFSPPYCKIKAMINEGKIGEVIHARCLRASATSPDKGWSPGATWFVQKKFCGGLIMDIAVHMADFLGWCCGKAKSVYAVNTIKIPGNDVPDNVTALIEFEYGANAVLELSWTIPCGGGYLEIYGTKGTIRLGFNDGAVELALPDKKYIKVRTKKIKNSQACFIDAIKGKAVTPVSGQEGRHALAYCVAIEKSGITGKPEPVEL